MTKISSSDKLALVKLASTLPIGSPERRAILAGFQVSASLAKGDLVFIPKGATYYGYDGKYTGLVKRENKENRALFMVDSTLRLIPNSLSFTNASNSDIVTFEISPLFKKIEVDGIVLQILQNLPGGPKKLPAKDLRMMKWLVGNMQVLGVNWDARNIQAAASGIDDGALARFPQYPKLRKLLS